MSKPQIGDRVKEKITGYAGVVTAKCEYITGCKQVLVNPPLKADGGYEDPRWFDEDRVDVTEAKVVTITVVENGFGEAAPIK